MPGNKKPRKKHRPRPILIDPVGRTIEGITLLGGQVYPVLYEVHEAMLALSTGKGGHCSWKAIAGTLNITKVLDIQHYGHDHKDEIEEAMQAHRECSARHARTGSFGYTGTELRAMNFALLLHEQMMHKATMNEMQLAITLAEQNKTTARQKVPDSAREI